MKVLPADSSTAADLNKSPSPPRRKRRWLKIGFAIALLVCVSFFIDRWMRPAAPATSDVNIVTEKNSQPFVKNSLTDILNEPVAADAHPLDPALNVAQLGLDFYRKNVRDYTAVFIKQERVGGRLAAEERSLVKFRQGRIEDGKVIPQSVYMRFIEPKGSAGREVIYIEGHNDGRLVAHEGGLLNVIRANLLPTSRLAMRGNRHPITDFGIEKLVQRMIEKGTRDRQHDDSELLVNRHIKINGHSGTEIKLVHSRPADHFDFHIARIIIDDEMNLPVGYEGYLWPEKGSSEPVLQERYFYTDVKLNVGLTDKDFDPDNPDYDYP